MYKCKYFGIKELVSPIVYNKWGEQAWMFFKESTLKGLDLFREAYNSPIIINNWASGGSLKQCGLRSNLDDIVLEKTRKNGLYLSAHCLAKGFDLHCKYGHNSKLWSSCLNLIKSKKAGDFMRIEAIEITPGWVHVDELQADNPIFS
jgi:hypothetical protein